ncbi:MAG: tyrosine-type recombinase/integrase [Gammaproteobacteria bacterium]|nr:tyrosine-type recombinase/integrase [Gammaproteobacteria bacterium]
MTQLIIPTRGLNDRFLKTVTVTQRTEIPDKACSGLYLRIGTSGTKTFVWRYRCKATQKIKRQTLGNYPTLSLAKARTQVVELKTQQQSGTIRQVVDDRPTTLTELAERFIQHKTLSDGKKDVLKRPDKLIQVMNHDVITPFGHLKLSSIDEVAVLGIIRKVVDRGARTHAGTLRGYLRQMFRWARTNRFIAEDPTERLGASSDLGIVTDARRERVLDMHPSLQTFDTEFSEYRAIFAALAAPSKRSNAVNSAIRLLALTGVRTGELRVARWENINFDQRIWTFPAADTKTGTLFRLPMTDRVIAILETLREHDNEFVFSVDSSPLGDKVITRALKRMADSKLPELERFTVHDFRRSMRSWMGHIRVAPHVAESCLNHSLGKILKTYDRSDLLPERLEALERWDGLVGDIVYPMPAELTVREKGLC